MVLINVGSFEQQVINTGAPQNQICNEMHPTTRHHVHDYRFHVQVL